MPRAIATPRAPTWAGFPVVEHLTGLDQLPSGFWFTAVPLRTEQFGTVPVRAFARLPG
jgi:kynurenine formamidase